MAALSQYCSSTAVVLHKLLDDYGFFIKEYKIVEFRVFIIWHALILQDNYSTEFCLQGRTSKDGETANLEQSVQR